MTCCHQFYCVRVCVFVYDVNVRAYQMYTPRSWDYWHLVNEKLAAVFFAIIKRKKTHLFFQSNKKYTQITNTYHILFKTFITTFDVLMRTWYSQLIFRTTNKILIKRCLVPWNKVEKKQKKHSSSIAYFILIIVVVLISSVDVEWNW